MRDVNLAYRWLYCQQTGVYLRLPTDWIEVAAQPSAIMYLGQREAAHNPNLVLVRYRLEEADRQPDSHYKLAQASRPTGRPAFEQLACRSVQVEGHPATLYAYSWYDLEGRATIVQQQVVAQADATIVQVIGTTYKAMAARYLTVFNEVAASIRIVALPAA